MHLSCTEAPIRDRAFCTLSFRRSHAGRRRSRQQSTEQVLPGLRCMSFGGCFYVLTGHDIVGNVNAILQSSFSQSHGASFDERHGATEQTAKHASQSLSTLYTSTDDVGQRATRLSRAIVATIHFRTDRSCDEENEASQSPYCVGMIQVVRYGHLYRTGSYRIL